MEAPLTELIGEVRELREQAARLKVRRDTLLATCERALPALEWAQALIDYHFGGEAIRGRNDELRDDIIPALRAAIEACKK